MQNICNFSLLICHHKLISIITVAYMHICILKPFIKTLIETKNPPLWNYKAQLSCILNFAQCHSIMTVPSKMSLINRKYIYSAKAFMKNYFPFLGIFFLIFSFSKSIELNCYTIYPISSRWKKEYFKLFAIIWYLGLNSFCRRNSSYWTAAERYELDRLHEQCKYLNKKQPRKPLKWNPWGWFERKERTTRSSKNEW